MNNDFPTLKHYASASDYKLLVALGLADLFDIVCEYYKNDRVPADTIKRLIYSRINGMVDMYTSELILRIAKAVIEFEKRENNEKE